MPRIGILGCEKTTSDMNCVMVGCLGNLRGREGSFKDYAEDDPMDLIGIIHCGGCPTVAGADGIWLKVNALTEYGVDTLHLTSCLVHLCPFKDDFIKAIKSEYPELKIVEGTHPFHDLNAFKSGIEELISQRAVTPQKMNDLVFKRIKISEGKEGDEESQPKGGGSSKDNA